MFILQLHASLFLKPVPSGKYSITIDSTQSKTFDGFANPEIIPAPLWVSDPLRLGQHTVIITNEWTDPSKPDLDIDSVRARFLQ